MTTIFALIPAVFDMIRNFPPVLAGTGFAKAAVTFASSYFPFFSIGFGWISFALCGFIIGLIRHFIAGRETATAAEEA